MMMHVLRSSQLFSINQEKEKRESFACLQQFNNIVRNERVYEPCVACFGWRRCWRVRGVFSLPFFFV
jgi:hypothetical protein